MKKAVFIAAALATLSIPLFAENKVGKLTGIQVKDSEVVLSIAEGLVNPFAEDGFVKSGNLTVSVPLDVAVEFYVPQRNREPDRPAPDADGAKDVRKKKDATAEKRSDEERGGPRRPALKASQLKIDQLVQVVYGEDGKSVAKIQTLPTMQGGMAKAGPGKPDENRFGWRGHDDDWNRKRGKAPARPTPDED